MTDWKSQIQVRDLDAGQRLEMTCRRCGHVHFVTREQLLADDGEAQYRYLDEIEARGKCRARGCGGGVRLAIGHQKKMTGFVGGMA